LISIIDYDVGNLASVEKAFQFIGSEAQITKLPQEVLAADAVVLPGVGAFADAMESLKKANMAEVVKEVIKKGIPFLGICLGMQLLFDYSEEGGEKVEGLGILKGSVKLFSGDMGLKVPHMGWNSIKPDKKCPLMEILPEKPYVYFVHSYFLDAEDKQIVAASCDYGIPFDAAVFKNNIFATQFHPEKSGVVGLQILTNFVKYANR
jgi:glutamine amidotransferase